MSRRCLSCKGKLAIPFKAYLNLERYKVGGTVLAASLCCNSPYQVSMNVSYSTIPYTGDEKKDDWGQEFNSPKIEKLNS